MYSDTEIHALAEQFSVSPVGDFLPFCRALLAGEKVQPPAFDLRQMMLLNDAANGVSWSEYWKGVMGWQRKAGAPIASTALHARSLAGPGTTVELDVTAAALRWQDETPLGLLLTISGSDCVFHSRQAVEPKNRPVMRLTYDSGIVEIPCLADATVSPKTSGTTGSGVTFRLGQGDCAALRFAALPIVGELQKAVIVLTIMTNYATGEQRLTLAEIEPPCNINPERIRDLWYDEEVYFRSIAPGHLLPDIDPYELNLRRQLMVAEQSPSWLEEDGPFLRMGWNPRIRGGGFRIPIFHPTTKADGLVVAFQYDVRIAANFGAACRESGKFPGFCSAGRAYTTTSNPWPGEPDGRRGELMAGNGGGNVHGNDGWSIRGGYMPKIGPGHPASGWTGLHSYSYHLSRMVGGKRQLFHEVIRRYEEVYGRVAIQGSLAPFVQSGEVLAADLGRTGQHINWDAGAPTGLLVPERWHRVAQSMRVNDVGSVNGWLKAYVDGHQVGEIQGLEHRNTRTPLIPNSTMGIGAVWFNFYHGGIQFPLTSTHIDLRRVVVKVLEWDS